MLFYIFLVTIVTVSLVASQPVDTDPDAPKEEVVYIPYAVKYVPVEVPIESEKTSQINKDSLQKTEDRLNEDFKVFPVKDNLKEIIEINKDGHSDLKKRSDKNKESSFDLFEDKFELDQAKSSEDYVLLPISVFKTLQENSKVDASSKVRVITKRQAPGFGARRRLLRRPALVGYQNEYDLFPTVA